MQPIIGINEAKDNQVIDVAAKWVFLTEKIKQLESDNQFLNDAYEAMCAEYMELLIVKHKLAKQVKRVKRLFGWLIRKYRFWKRRAKLLEEWKARGYQRLKSKLNNPNELS